MSDIEPEAKLDWFLRVNTYKSRSKLVKYFAPRMEELEAALAESTRNDAIGEK